MVLILKPARMTFTSASPLGSSGPKISFYGPGSLLKNREYFLGWRSEAGKEIPIKKPHNHGWCCRSTLQQHSNIRVHKFRVKTLLNTNSQQTAGSIWKGRALANVKTPRLRRYDDFQLETGAERRHVYSKIGECRFDYNFQLRPTCLYEVVIQFGDGLKRAAFWFRAVPVAAMTSCVCHCICQTSKDLVPVPDRPVILGGPAPHRICEEKL